MTTETNDLAGAGSEIVAPVEPAQDLPEVAAPESNAQEAQPNSEPKEDSADKSLQRLQRRIDRVTAARYEQQAKAEQAERRAAELEARLRAYETQGQKEETQPQFRPEDIDRLANERAQYLKEMESVSKRSTEIRDALAKKVGDKLPAVIAAVVEEAGDLAQKDGRWTPLGEAIADCEAPDAVLTYLAENPDIAASLNGLSAARVGRRIEAIERDMKASAVSKAPAPIKPVTPKGAPIAKAESEMTDAEWYAARRKR